MRWLKEYPITQDEVLAVLEKIPMDNPLGTTSLKNIGGVSDTIRHHLIEFVKKDANMAAFLKEMRC